MKARIADTKKAGAEVPKLGAECLKSVDQELAAYDQVITRGERARRGPGVRRDRQAPHRRRRAGSETPRMC